MYAFVCEAEEKSDINVKEEDHEPTLVRQGIFYIIILTENLFLTLYPAIHAGERIPIDDGFHQFSISYNSLCNIIITIWALWFLQLVCLLVYYATHPSSVATHPKHYATKMKVI